MAGRVATRAFEYPTSSSYEDVTFARPAVVAGGKGGIGHRSKVGILEKPVQYLKKGAHKENRHETH